MFNDETGFFFYFLFSYYIVLCIRLSSYIQLSIFMLVKFLSNRLSLVACDIPFSAT